MIFSCCSDVAPITFTVSLPILTSTLRPLRNTQSRIFASTAASPAEPHRTASVPVRLDKTLRPLRDPAVRHRLHRVDVQINQQRGQEVAVVMPIEAFAYLLARLPQDSRHKSLAETIERMAQIGADSGLTHDQVISAVREDGE